MEQACKDGFNKAIELSSGTMSIGQLKDLDHPYARRHGMSLLPPEVINTNSGEFLESWKLGEVETTNKKVTGDITNNSRVADYLTQPDGSDKSNMNVRPIDKSVEEYVEQQLEIYILENLKAFDDMNFEL